MALAAGEGALLAGALPLLLGLFLLQHLWCRLLFQVLLLPLHQGQQLPGLLMTLSSLQLQGLWLLRRLLHTCTAGGAGARAPIQHPCLHWLQQSVSITLRFLYCIRCMAQSCCRRCLCFCTAS